jgi:hypothetical protein
MALEPQKKEADIKAAIEKITGGKRYDVWTIGTCDNPTLRREEHGRPTIWHYFDVDTPSDAFNAEHHFKAKGMKGYTGEKKGSPDFLYITWC